MENEKDSSIVTFNLKMSRSIRKEAEASFVDDVKKIFMGQVKAMMGDKMRLSNEIQDRHAAIAKIDAKLAAIESGEATYDIPRGKMIYPEGLEG